MSDRLEEIERCVMPDMQWLIAEVKRLREDMQIAIRILNDIGRPDWIIKDNVTHLCNVISERCGTARNAVHDFMLKGYRL